MYKSSYPNSHTHRVKNQNRIEENKNLILRLKDIIHTTNYCAICFRRDKQLNSLDDDVFIDEWDEDSLPNMMEVLDTVFGWELPSVLSSNSICEICQKKAVDAYTFTQNAIRSANVVTNYLEQIENRIEDVTKMMKVSPNNTDFANTVLVISYQEETYHKMLKDIKHQESSDEENVIKTPKWKLEKSENKQNNGSVHSTFICDYCQKDFVTKQAIACHISRQHMMSKSKTRKAKYIRKFQCPDCVSEDCIHKTYLQSYKKQRLAGQKLIKCPDCDYACYLKPYLIAHVNKMHLKTFTFQCKECGKPLHSKLAYNMHKKMFHSKYHTCQYCERQFMFTNNLDAHRETCKTVQRAFKCNSCPFSVDSKEKFSAHNRKHLKNYPCELCNKVLATSGGLKLHREMHLTNKRIKLRYNYFCHICNKTFSSHTQRELHAKTHDPDDSPKCISCNLQFNTSQEYLKHMQSNKHNVKLGRKLLKCEHCPYSVYTETSLEGHINRYHLKIAPYSCSQCDKKFTNTQKLGVHMKTHQAVKRHQCGLCGNYFCGPTALKKHVRLHTGERPYACEICGDRFISNGIKNVHILRKHKTKTVSCPLCQSMFHSLPIMRSHFKKAHWKFKGEKFDVTKVEGLREEDYDLFRDRRILRF